MFGVKSLVLVVSISCVWFKSLVLVVLISCVWCKSLVLGCVDILCLGLSL